MSHLALYRRLRPKNFSEIVDQRHVVRILKNQLSAGTTSHAYLFCGTRGTGKTSMAKILAKALNCTNLHEVTEPCNICESCMAANENRNLNIIEIDAASNNGVDNVREIREEVKYPPQDGGVKVYIIDEVHMLSTGAFNALLKTLEEPPVRVVFILATTDVQRIPATILSRCVRLDFKRINADEMSLALKNITDTQDINISDDALKYICSVSDGAMRDALSLLDQCISYYQEQIKNGDEIDEEMVLALTGAADGNVFFELMDALTAYESDKCLAIIQDMVDLGRDVSRFISDFIHHLRNLLVSSSGGALADVSISTREKYQAQVKTTSSKRLIALVHEFSALSASLRYSLNERIMLECLCIKLCNPQSAETQDLGAIISRLEKLESAPVVQHTAMPREMQDDTEPKAKAEKPKVSTASKPAPQNVPDDVELIISEWEQFKKTFPPPLSVFLENTSITSLGDGLCIIFSDDSWISHVKERADVINQAVSDKYGKQRPIVFVSQDEYDDSPGKEPNVTEDEQLPKKLGEIEIEWE